LCRASPRRKLTALGENRGDAMGREWSGLRESNPSSWLGKPEHYHYAKPARRARPTPPRAGHSPASVAETVVGTRYWRMNASTSSRLASITSAVVASRFSRSSGSVFDGRTLKCQSSNSTDTPSMR
jgi:hypothetical protein